MRVKVLLNKAGGSFTGKDPAAIGNDVAEAFRTHGLDAEVLLLDPNEIAPAAEEAARDPALDALAVGGGDGTIGIAAQALAGTELALAVLPLGTLNHLARDAGIPGDLDAAVALIASTAPRPIDLAEVNGRVFVNNSAVGLYPLMVRDRDIQRSRLHRSKRVAMIVASGRALYRFGRHRLTIRIAGREALLETPLLFVGNNRYGTALLNLGKRDALDRGELCIYAALARTRYGFVRLAVRALFNRLDQERDFVRLDGVTEAEIRSRRPRLDISADGEIARVEPPLHYRIRPGALRLIMPAPPPA